MREREVRVEERERARGAGRGVSPKRTQGAVGARPGWYLEVVIVLLLATLVTQARVAELAFAVARAGVVAEPGRLVEAGKCKEQGQPWPHDGCSSAVRPAEGCGVWIERVSCVVCGGTDEDGDDEEDSTTSQPRASDRRLTHAYRWI